MKSAITADGNQIIAAEEAPQTAVCPHCGSPVLLRRRQSMSGEVTYFWRHKRGATLACSKRSSPIGRRENHLQRS